MENNNFRNYMSIDEYILWQGKPERSFHMSADSIITLPFGLFFFGFACVWAFLASQAAPFMAIAALPFMAVGLYVSFGRLIHKYILLGKTEYAVTNKKLIRISGQKIDIVEADRINNMQLTMNKNGTGTIIFLSPEVHYRGTKTVTSYPGGFNGFYAIENIKDPIIVQQKIGEMEK